MPRTKELEAQVRAQLGDRADDFDTAGVVADLVEQFGWFRTVGNLPADVFWWTVMRRDLRPAH
jgi:hypothetical protein